MPHSTRPTAAHEPEGYEYIAFIGQITTLETDDESFGLWEQAPRIPFGFQAPDPVVVEVDAPALTSQDWAAWLDPPRRPFPTNSTPPATLKR